MLPLFTKLLLIKPLDIGPAILWDVRQQSGSFRNPLKRLFVSRVVLQRGLGKIENHAVFPFGDFRRRSAGDFHCDGASALFRQVLLDNDFSGFAGREAPKCESSVTMRV
jgi:hypothetical protein